VDPAQGIEWTLSKHGVVSIPIDASANSLKGEGHGRSFSGGGGKWKEYKC